jgi:hypothetical protein
MIYLGSRLRKLRDSSWVTSQRAEQISSSSEKIRSRENAEDSRLTRQSEFQAQLGSVGVQEPSQPNSLLGPGRSIGLVSPRGTLKWPASALLVKAVKAVIISDCNLLWLSSKRMNSGSNQNPRVFKSHYPSICDYTYGLLCLLLGDHDRPFFGIRLVLTGFISSWRLYFC